MCDSKRPSRSFVEASTRMGDPPARESSVGGGTDIDGLRGGAVTGVVAAIAGDVNARLVIIGLGVHQRTSVHRVDANQNAEKIGSLRDLKNARLTGRSFSFDTHFTCARKNLTSHEKRDHFAHQPVPRHSTAHQIVVVTTVTMPGEVRIVFIEANFVTRWQLLISAPCALC